MTNDEEEAFSPVGLTNYFSGAVRMGRNIQPATLYSTETVLAHIPPDAKGEPVSFIRLFNDSEIVTTWSWSAYRTQDIEFPEAKELLVETLSKVNRDPDDVHDVSVPITAADVKGFLKVDYFPHYDSEALNAGWYEKFNDLQGKKNTYWVSGLNGFETVEFAVRAALDIAESFFPVHTSDGHSEL